jgi:hypothetical protein
MNSGSYTHLIFHKDAKNIDEERTASLTNDSGKTGYLHAEN